MPSSPPGSLPLRGAGSEKQRSLEPGCLDLAPLAPVQCLLALSFLSYCSQHVWVTSPNSPGSNIPFLHNLQSTFCLQHREVISSPFLKVATMVLVSGS